MTIISMITLSALVLTGLSHMAAARAYNRQRRQTSAVPTQTHPAATH